MKKTVHVVVQTHWDREWYLAHQTSIARLIAVMERVVADIESGALQSFLFDGQTAALEDLLVHSEPALAARVKKLIATERIIVGPWYVMADEFLVSGESLIRNLEIGISDSRKYGREQRVGYLPDTFGHIAQMPQVLRLFSIDTAVVWRGVDIEASEFLWCAPDGSHVKTLFLTQGYYQHPLNVVDWKLALNRYLEQIAPRATTPHLLLTQGGDHLLPSQNVAARIAEFNASQSEFELRWSTLEDALDVTFHARGSSQLHVVKGELRENKQAFVLPDVLSTRRYLKQLHQLTEDRLLGEIEPLLAKYLPTQDYPAHYLDQCWRLLIQQQAHDSICGCSIDDVHREMETRFAQLNQRLDALKQKVLVAAGMHTDSQHVETTTTVEIFGDDTRCTLFNPLPQRFEGWQTIELFLRDKKRAGPRPCVVNAEAGSDLIDYELLSVTSAEEFHSPLDDFPDRLAGHRYRFAVNASIAGFASLALELRENGIAVTRDLEAAKHEIGNSAYKIAVEGDGSITITDVIGGCSIKRAVTFVHETDVGDSYNYSPLPAISAIRVDQFVLRNVSRHRTVQTLTLHVVMRVPAALVADRSAAADTFVENTGELTLTLFENSPRISANLQWRNKSQDQRTRLLLRWQSSAPNYTESDSAFHVDRRDVRIASYPTTASRTEMPVVVHPSHSIVVGGGWWFAHHAMQEHEVVDIANERFLGLTLVRSVGWLSRRDLVTRGVGAGPDFATPEAQCLRAERFDFQFGVADTKDSKASIDAAFGAARSLRRPLLVLRGHAEKSLLAIDIGNATLQVSAIRVVGDEIELRLWNPTSIAQKITTTPDAWRAHRVDNSQQDFAADTIGPHAVVTLRAQRSQLSISA
jgi:mannosylglycerate hydrolase